MPLQILELPAGAFLILEFTIFMMRLTLRKVTIFLLSIAVCSSAWAQSQELDLDGEYLEIYQGTEKALKNDPLLQNGLFYAYPYFSAHGNPFLGDGEFESGTVIFREKSYEGISINYDIFNQQIILSRKTGDMLLMNLMANEFISGFSFKGKNFIRATLPGESASFYQVISESKNIACYYIWYKERREILDAGNQRIYSFSEEKSKYYLFMDGMLNQYKNNRSYIQLLLDGAGDEIKRYLKENRLNVKEASDQEMLVLIEYCNSILDRDSKLGGG